MHERLNDIDPPLRRDAALAPFQTRRFVRAQFGAGIVYEFPGERRVGHDTLIGQTVPFVKDQMSNDLIASVWHGLSMRELMTPEEFEAMLIERTKALRESRGMTSAEMATALDIPADRYRKYESRTPMPHALLERFALIAGVSVEFLISGRRIAGKGPYPDVPGPHMLDEWRANRAKAKPSKRGRPPLKK